MQKQLIDLQSELKKTIMYLLRMILDESLRLGRSYWNIECWKTSSSWNAY